MLLFEEKRKYNLKGPNIEDNIKILKHKLFSFRYWNLKYNLMDHIWQLTVSLGFFDFFSINPIRTYSHAFIEELPAEKANFIYCKVGIHAS